MGTASMARKRHLASSARGFICFCLAPTIRKQICPNRGGKNPEDGVFIFVYRLAMDARPERVMMGLTENV